MAELLKSLITSDSYYYRMGTGTPSVIIGRTSEEVMAAAFKNLPEVNNYAIKVNLCTIASSPVTTSVESVRDVITRILEINPDARIKVVESDATALNADIAFKRLGYTELEHTEVVNLSKDDSVKADIDGLIIGTLNIPLTLYECECLINMARLKTHVFTKVSLGAKNLFGLITRKDKESLHPFLDSIIVDLIGFYRPDLTIIEGNMGIEGRGPVDGLLRQDNVFIAGDDVLSTDLVAAAYMGIKKVPHLELAKKVLGKRDIQITGKAELLNNPYPYKTMGFLPCSTTGLGFYVASIGRRLEMLGNSIAFVGDVLGAVDREMLKQKISYRDAASMLLRRATKIDI
ncbi:hypothetical protein ANME2D_02799 [Candidatus Methanoperedens nitroreducens]|uniref:DUF362 domain-containing protein n=2 Tax=Candidatus Methanoperedens nitratireducens TaxID=1392998 RepID=A0A062V4N0_9EURY|nr:hypothetical protein ANME2D_02799 [Candidatus Methanoperedens nitroreducens]